MKNKGFTLVEIMAVLVIMCVLLTVTITSLFNSIDRKKKSEHQKIVDEIIASAELYVTQNSEVQEFLNNSANDEINIPYNTLKTEGLLPGITNDPLTSEPWNETSYVKIKKSSESSPLESSYHEGTSELTISITASPTTISSKEMYYTDKLLENVTAIDSTGINYKSAITYKCQVDDSNNQSNCQTMKTKPGIHNITYILKYDNNEYKTTTTITIN